MSNVGVHGQIPPEDRCSPVDYVIERQGSDYYAYHYKNGFYDRNSDFGDLFNDLFVAGMGRVGSIGIRGGSTYEYATTPQALGDGIDPHGENPVQVIGLGSPFPILQPDPGVKGFEYGRGIAIELDRLHIDMPLTGAAVNGLHAERYAAGTGAGECGSYWAKFGNMRISGGVTGAVLWYAEDMEFYRIYGTIHIGSDNPVVGVAPMKFVNTIDADYAYNQSTNVGSLYLAASGAVAGLELLGSSDAKALNLLDWVGTIWTRNSNGADGSIGVKLGYVVSSKLGTFHVENNDIILQHNNGAMALSIDFGNTYSFCKSSAANKIGLDMNGGYATTINRFRFYFGSGTSTWVDDENNDQNAPHKYEDITLQGAGGTCLQSLGTYSKVETYGAGDKPYRKLGSGTFP